MKQNKRYNTDVWVFAASLLTFIYILLMYIAYISQWNEAILRFVMELITIPIFLVGLATPLIAAFRLISKKTKNRRLSIITLFISLLSAIFIGFVS